MRAGDGAGNVVTVELGAAFPGVRGHARPQAQLIRAIERDQLHHAVVLAGPRGVGKARLARAIAAGLHCRERPGAGCGACDSCRRIERETHAGVEWVRPPEPGKTIPVEQVRELRNRIQHAPFEGDHHVVILDPADGLNAAGYNALLKILEEPPPGLRFVLTIEAVARLLPTIVSRCLVVRVGRLEDADVSALASEHGGADATRIELATALAQGSAGSAVQLLGDEGLTATLELVGHCMEARRSGARAVFCGDNGPLWQAWKAATDGPPTGRPARERHVARQVCQMWLLHLRQCQRGVAGLPGLPRWSPEEAQAATTPVLGLLDSLERNPNVRLALEHALLQLSPPRA